jgi:hypothetical protein
MTVMTTQATRPARWWSALIALPTGLFTALADSTRDWRRGCGL